MTSYYYLRDVFTLSEFEDVLLAVNNLQLAVFSPLTNVASVEPAVFVNGFLAAVTNNRQ
jgi:hypothetical protein